MLTLPNGVTAQYGYASNSRLPSISYSAQGLSLGNLPYVYDALADHISVWLGATLADSVKGEGLRGQ